MEYKLVFCLKEHQIEELCNLYQEEWWTKGRDIEDVRKAVAHSSVVFAFIDEQESLAAFARVLSDFTYKALIVDVIVRKDYRGNGLGKRLIENILSHIDLKTVKKFELYCVPEMIPFYEKWGFSSDLKHIKCMRLNNI